MRAPLRTIITFLGVIAAVLIVGGLIGWFGGGFRRDTVTAPRSNESVSPPSSKSPQPPPRSVRAPVAPVTNDSNEATAVVPVSPPPREAAVNWDEKLDQILGSEIDDNEKARQMIEMFPKLPPEGQSEVADHIVNLTADDQFAAIGVMLTNAATEEEVLDKFLADALNRPNSVKLPIFFQIARNPQHPKATEAKDLLELYLEDDYGDDWAKWEKAAEQYVKENPD